jgi:hypothetical protein
LEKGRRNIRRPFLFQSDNLVPLKRQSPEGPLHNQGNRGIDRRLPVRAVHRLNQVMTEIPTFQVG